jgi:hypothetical protein
MQMHDFLLDYRLFQQPITWLNIQIRGNCGSGSQPPKKCGESESRLSAVQLPSL